MSIKFTPEDQAAQLRKPGGPEAEAIAAYMAGLNTEMYEATFRHLNMKEGMTVLELGPGEAPLAGRIVDSARNISYTGIDYSPEMVSMAQKHWAQKPGVRLIDGEIAGMPFADGTFDLVFGINVVYFWDKPETELREIRRVMKPGGRLVLGYRPKDKMQAIPFTQFGFNLYNPSDLEKLMADNGFNRFENHVFKENPRFAGGREIPMESCVMSCVKV